MPACLCTCMCTCVCSVLSFLLMTICVSLSFRDIPSTNFHISAPVQVSGDSDLRLQQQKIEVKSREEMMGKVPPQVAVIPPIIDLTRTPEYSQIEKLKGQGMSGDVGKGRKSPSILVDVAVASTEGQQRGHSGEMKNVEKTTAGQRCVCVYMAYVSYTCTLNLDACI